MKRMTASLLALLLLLSGCYSPGTPSESAAQTPPPVRETAAAAPETSAGAVYWLNIDPAAQETLQELALRYTEETDVRVEVVAPQGDYGAALAAEMDKAAAPTLFMADSRELLEDWGEYCYDLEGTPLANECLAASVGYWDGEGRLCALPCDLQCRGLLVNAALLAEAGYAWEELTGFAALKAAAEDIHARRDELGFDAFAALGTGEDALRRVAECMAAPAIGLEAREGGWSRCAPALEGTYLGALRGAVDLSLRAGAEASGRETPLESFVQGRSVFLPGSSGDFGACLALGADALAMIPCYCGIEGEEAVGPVGRAERYWAVNALSSGHDIQATLDFLYWLVNDAQASARLNALWGALPYRYAARPENAFLAAARRLGERGLACLPWPCDQGEERAPDTQALGAALELYAAQPNEFSWRDVADALREDWAARHVQEQP